MITVKRVYEPAAEDEGTRFLVDRLWPRGLKRESVRLDGWLRDVAPSDRLRRWYDHRSDRWEEFRRRYFTELDERPNAWRPILEAGHRRNVTLLFGARDLDHNNAVALRDYLMAKLKRQ